MMKDQDVEAIEATEHGSTAGNFDEPVSFSQKWTNIINQVHKPVLKGLRKLTQIAAMNPKSTILAVTIFSIGVLVLGLFTNFNVDVDEDILWTPRNSHPLNHMKWIDDESGFPTRPRAFIMVFHQEGSTEILGQSQVGHIFEAVDAVRGLPNYQSVCSNTESGDCEITGVIKFWNNTASIFEEQVFSDEDAIADMSVSNYPDDGTPVSDNDIFGNSVRDEATGLLVSAQSYIVIIELPDTEEMDDDVPKEQDAVAFESDALDVILDLDEKWEAESGNVFRVEVIADRSFGDEFERAIANDLPLLPIVFILMGAFTSAIFFKKDRIRSRSLLGFTAVVSVLLSIMAGYGLMFVCAVPFTSMTTILPFVFFGVGLDDAFIITGSYSRTKADKDPADRIRDVIDDVGLSIFLTTLTSTMAFALGCMSSIPAVFWLCVYAVPNLIFIFLWQITFFVACIVLDERRIQYGKADCLCCCSPKIEGQDQQENAEESDDEPAIVRFMGWYAEKLLRPWVKVCVILAFAGIAVACAFSTSRLEQSFEFTDVLPSGSYITDFFNAFNDYSVRSSVAPFAYFRYVDQSDPEIQKQMEDYINDLVTVDAVLEQPDRFWLRDFKVFVNQTESVSDLDFTTQLDAFLADPVFNELYSNDIVRDGAGTITASRCLVPMDNVDVEDVKDQIDALEDQRSVTKAQPINKGKSDFWFFTYDGIYNIWEFYSASATEIMLTTISGVAAVTGVTLFFVPHWTAALFVLPLICILYIDLLGVLQWADVSVNPVSYIALVMSIGLLVDFVLHILLRYFEAPGNRTEKCVDMLKTMGSSILIGAITTLLGTLPLVFSSSDIFNTIFYAFLGLVTLGATHGLVLLPVVLSMIGPEEQVKS